LHQFSAKFAAVSGGDIVHGQAVALKQLWALTYLEAQVQTFEDAFLVVGVCLAIAAMLVPLLRKVTTPTAPSADAH
jgi:MFS transporter, DHA2 family, multidrug resistance protein